MIDRKDILAALEGADQLPPFPDVLIRLERELSQPDVSVLRLASLLEEDVALVAQLLRVANSAYYGGRTRITSVADAAIRLGMQELRSIVYTAAVIGRYRPVGRVNMPLFWGHSLAVGMAAGAVCRSCKVRVPKEVYEAAYVAGLLHDLGAIALTQWFPEESFAAHVAIREHGGTASAYELEMWGIEHGEVGGLLAERWSIPVSIQQAIMHHHQPWLVGPEHRTLVRVIHIADFICNNLGFGRDESVFPNWFDPEAWDALGLSIEDSQSIISQVRAAADKSIVLTKVLVQ